MTLAVGNMLTIAIPLTTNDLANLFQNNVRFTLLRDFLTFSNDTTHNYQASLLLYNKKRVKSTILPFQCLYFLLVCTIFIYQVPSFITYFVILSTALDKSLPVTSSSLMTFLSSIAQSSPIFETR